MFARTVKPNGPTATHAVVVVRKGSGITLDKLLKCDKSLTFCMGDSPSRTSGTLAPMTPPNFAPRGMSDPNDCFSTVRSTNHGPGGEPVRCGARPAGRRHQQHRLDGRGWR